MSTTFAIYIDGIIHKLYHIIIKYNLTIKKMQVGLFLVMRRIDDHIHDTLHLGFLIYNVLFTNKWSLPEFRYSSPIIVIVFPFFNNALGPK